MSLNRATTALIWFMLPLLLFVLVLLIGQRRMLVNTEAVSAAGARVYLPVTYDLGPLDGHEVEMLLNRLFHPGNSEGTPAGRAVLLPSGKLAVSAPTHFHPAIQAMIDELAASPAPAGRTVHMDYWIVQGTPGEQGADAPGLGEVLPALQEIWRTVGPMEFQLIEHLSQNSLNGVKGQTAGARAQVHQVAVARGDVISARIEVELSASRSEISTQVTLPVDSLLVLGHSGYQSSQGDSADGDLIFYVVRARIL